ncbi:MAG: hypothetical protein QOJ15_5339 [Bradyrhizobium sp.]|nr:hypothetical protein [Bradyrhizobium sp.]
MPQADRELEELKARLQATEERLRSAEAAGGIAIFDFDYAMRQWQFGPQVAVLFGVPARDTVPTFADLSPTVFVDDLPKLEAAVAAAERSPACYVEFRIRHGDGSFRWLACRGQSAGDGRDRRLRGAFYDITERKSLEARLLAANETLEARVAERASQLEASRARLENTELRFRLLVESVAEYAIYMLDLTGQVASWNRGAQRIKGYTREEIVGHHFSRFYSEEDRRNEVPRQALETAARTGKYEAEGWRMRKDGSRFWASVVINAVYDADGQVIGFAKVTRGLTERRTAEEAQRQAQKMESVGHLTGGVAHDFNNLLTVVIGNLEALQRHLGEPGPDLGRLRQSADNAMRGAQRAASLTQRLLAFSRQQPLEPKSVNIDRLVTGMSDLLRQTLGEHVGIETIMSGGLWRAHVDPNQLEVAILNLAVNARDAMPKGGKLTIETANVFLDEAYASAQSEVLPGQYVMVAVTDTGTGMPPDVAGRAFEPFFTTKDVGQGTGLGLSQVYGFVKQSRGHVKIYSEVGEGTTIKLYLPRWHSEEATTPGEAPPPVVRGAAGETVLVVEDDPDVRSYATDTLRELGYDVLEAESAQAALQLIEHHPEIRVLFTDVGLPGGMNGRQLADAARALRRGLKVVFTSGYARNAVDPGVELITKPFTQAALAERLRRIIDAGSGPARILVVEDEPLIQMLAKELLEDGGLQVELAGSATEALNKLRLVPGGVDAVLLDIGLPDRRGDVLLGELRAIYPSLPVVLATGYGQVEPAKLAGDHAKVSSVGKPYTAKSLLTALRSLGVRC